MMTWKGKARMIPTDRIDEMLPIPFWYTKKNEDKTLKI